MLVEIWSDVVCPWCYIGKRQFETALASFAHRDDVTVTWRSFELDPNAPTQRSISTNKLLEKKYGISEAQAEAASARVAGVAAGVGLDCQWDKAVSGNTFDAHRLIHLAATHGRGDAAKEALMAAYFTHGEPIGERATLEQVAAEVGLDADEVATVLAGTAFSDEVRSDEQRATRLGISGVPFFVIDQTYGISGAQSPDVLLNALETAWSESHPLTMVTASTNATKATNASSTTRAEADGEACTDSTCAI